MDRLNLAAGERYDQVHNTILLDGVEALARKNNLAVLRGGAGLIRLPSAITYDSGTQRFTLPSGTVLMDAVGNVAELTSSLQTGVVAPASVGVAGLFIWAAIQPGTTPTNALVRVKNVGSGVVSFSTNTAKVDAVTAQVSATLPSNLSNPTAIHFPIATMTWDGGVPNEATATPISPLALGNSGVPGSVLDVLQDLATALDGIMGDDWFATPADDLVSIDARATALEVDRVSLSLSGHFQGAGSSTVTMSGSGIILTGIDATADVIRIGFSPHYKSTITTGTAIVTYGAGVTVNFKLTRLDANTGVSADISDIAAASDAGGETRAVLSVTAAHLADLSDGMYEAIFSFTKPAGGGTAAIHFGSVAGTIAP